MPLGFVSPLAVRASPFLGRPCWVCRRRRNLLRRTTRNMMQTHKLTMKAKAEADTTARLVKFCTNQGVDREVAARVIDLAQRTIRDWSTSTSDFLTPPESVTILTAVESLADGRALPWGGYDDAERRALFISHADVVTDNETLQQLANEQLVLLKIVGNFEIEKASNRDFMGAVLNAGISRQKIGDIIVQENSGAHVIVHGDIAPFLQTAVTSVRNTKVAIETAAMSELNLPPKRVKELQSVESSMRLDAVVSAGFKLSRSKLADMTRSGLVSLNYKEMRSPAKNVKTGDIISIRGVGKLEIGEYIPPISDRATGEDALRALYLVALSESLIFDSLPYYIKGRDDNVIDEK